MNGRDLGLLFGGFIIGVATGIMFKRREEPVEEPENEPDVEFEVKDSDTPVKVSAHEDRMLRRTYMIALINELDQKIKKETEDGNKPYSKENPPSPMTEVQLRVYDELKKKRFNASLEGEEAIFLHDLEDYEELLNMYSKEK